METENTDIVEVRSIREMEVRSEAIEEIVGRPPSWIVRFGVSLLFSTVVLFILFAFFFHYPDVVPGQVVLTTVNVPATLMARTQGKITHRFVSENDSVDAGEILAVLENSASLNDVLFMEKNLSSPVNFADTACCDSLLLPLSLGSLDAPYSVLIQKYDEYRNYRQTDYDQQKINALKKQYAYTSSLTLQYRKQASLMEQEYKLAANQYNRDSSLHVQKVIPDAELETGRKELLRVKYSAEGAKTALIQSSLQCSSLEEEILSIKLQRESTLRQHLSGLAQARQSLLAALAEWKQTYLLNAPVAGKVSFLKAWEVNQEVKAGEPVLTIVPYGNMTVTGRMNLPPSGSGKVVAGQKVNVMLDNFPYLEFGMLEGRVKSISLVPVEGNYLVEIEFPRGLRTNSNHDLSFRQEISGTADIITEDRRLIERLISPLRFLFDKWMR